jgi:hypothetical protein
MIHAAMVAMVGRLIVAGVPAALDERDLNPPGVLVRPPEISYRFGGCAEATWTLLAAVPDTGTGPALVALSDLVDRARAALGGEITVAVPAQVTGTDHGAPLPAYRLTLSTDIP